MTNGEAKPNGVDSGIDSLALPNGRKLKLRTPSGANYLIAVEISGQAMALIPTYEALLCIAQIDSEPQPVPRTRRMMEVLCDKLGREGLDIVLEWHQRKAFPEIAQAVRELEGGSMQDIQQRIVELRDERLKKSLETQ